MSLVELVASLIPAGTKLPILAGPLRGFRWIAGAAAGHGGGLSVLLHRAERSQLELARQWVGPSSVCFDIGANVGLYTLLFGRYGGKVVAFEPLPRKSGFEFADEVFGGLVVTFSVTSVEQVQSSARRVVFWFVPAAIAGFYAWAIGIPSVTRRIGGK